MKHVFLMASIAVASFSGAAQAAILDFAGDICLPGGVCGDAFEISQDYGDIPGQVDVIYDASTGTPGNQPFLIWVSGGYETLDLVAYSGNNDATTILFEAAPGFEVAVSGFDVAPFLNQVRTTRLRVSDPSQPGAPLLDTGEFEVSTDEVSSFSLTELWAGSILIEFGPDAFNVGISNIVYDVRWITTVVPLPATALLLIGGLGALAGLRFRRL